MSGRKGCSGSGRRGEKQQAAGRKRGWWLPVPTKQRRYHVGRVAAGSALGLMHEARLAPRCLDFNVAARQQTRVPSLSFL